MTITTLAHHIDAAWLREAYRLTRKNAAPGVDGQTAAAYATNLNTNLDDLLQRFKSGRYHAPPVRRVEIPKGDGRVRPIGVPTFEDKVLQRAVAMVLEPIYEEDFEEMSHGFRPGRSAHTALANVWEQLMRMHGGWVLEVDIENFFESVDHAHLRSCLDQRVRDGVIRRVIDKWLSAGVLDAGTVRPTSAGTPQGGVLSPLLANVYLHEVVDRWFVNEVRPRMIGACFATRYADDIIFVFASREDAERVRNVLPKRLARFGLRAHSDKTRLVDFRRPRRPRKGIPPEPPGTFVLLGFTHYWGKSSVGTRVPVVKRKTSSKSLSRSLKQVTAYCRRYRHQPVPVQHEALSKKVQGHDGYFGITGNGEALDRFRQAVFRIWAKWLGRRNPRRARATACSNIVVLAERFALPEARVVHSIYART
jgi:group II intron reverse transcriptase/maturase